MTWENPIAMDERLRAEASPEALANEQWVSDYGGCRRPFTAELNGERYRFEAVEHFNIGPGWMCFELDGKLPKGVYGTAAMRDLQQWGDGSRSPPPKGWAYLDGYHEWTVDLRKPDGAP